MDKKELQEDEKHAVEPSEEKPPTTKEQFYDKIPLSLRQLDMIIIGVLALIIFLIIMGRSV